MNRRLLCLCFALLRKRRREIANVEEATAAALLRARYVSLINHLHHRDARPLTNSVAMLRMYLEKYGPSLPPERKELLSMILGENLKALDAYKKLQNRFQTPPENDSMAS